MECESVSIQESVSVCVRNHDLSHGHGWSHRVNSEDKSWHDDDVCVHNKNVACYGYRRGCKMSRTGCPLIGKQANYVWD